MPLKNNYRALVADDDEQIRHLVIAALSQRDFACDPARNGIAATNLLGMHQYDAVIIDLRMPEKHGHDVLVELLDQRYPAVLIAITGLKEPRVATDLIARGVADVVQKPFDVHFFAAKVRALVERHAKTRLEETRRASGGAQPGHVADQIDQVRTTLKSQLEDITHSFQSTIDDLEKQKEKVELGFVESVRLLTGIVEGIERAGESHVGRVEDIAQALAKLAGLKGQETLDLRIASLLHEIGVVGMPDRIRNKPPWTLSPEDRDIFQQYPMLSATIIGGISGAEYSAQLIEQHMENYDGTGFPKGLKGKEIEMGARIIRVAEGIDLFAMHADPKPTAEQLCAHVRSERGKAYDPVLADFAIQHLQDFEPASEEVRTFIVPKNELRPGMILAENVYNESGQFLLRKGTELTESGTKRLCGIIPDGARIRVQKEKPQEAE